MSYVSLQSGQREMSDRHARLTIAPPTTPQTTFVMAVDNHISVTTRQVISCEYVSSRLAQLQHTSGNSLLA